MKKHFPALLCLAALLAPSQAVHAQAEAFPSKPVRMAIPFPPGGATDMIARTLSEKVQQIWGQPLVLEYKPGAGGIIAGEFVARSAPDGHTVGMVTTSFLINPSLRKSLPYDTLRDFAGVSTVAVSHILFAGTLSLPANTLAEVIALAKKQPGKLAYATPGPGGAMHMSGELLKHLTGIDIVHVPYKGGAAAYPDLMTGRVQLMFDPVFAIMPMVKSGKIKAIAMASPERARTYPDIPVIAETVPGYSVLSITGIVAPRATPRPVISRMSADIARALQDPTLRSRMSDAGMEPRPMSPERFDAYIKAEIEKWSKVVKSAGITPD